MKILQRLASYFLQGIILVVPLAATLYVIFYLFNFIDNLLPFKIPGLGILVLLITITFLGFLGTTIIAKPILRYFQSLLNKIPAVNSVYTVLKDLINAFIGKNKSFDKPVMVKLSKDTQVYKLGFVTVESLTNIGVDENMIAVYLPHSYNFSGNLFIVPKENVTPIEAKAADVMKFIVSAGVANIKPTQNNLDNHPNKTESL
jgi:uncharacterized membrane protein